MVAPLTATMIEQLNNSNAAHQRAQIGTLLGRITPAGYVFYVDGNFGDDDDNDGSSWGSPFKTLAVAMAASAVAIASGEFGWAARNVIYAKADSFVEDLVLLAPKTDVVGVGSYDQWAQCGLVGNHVPTGVTASFGTRFYNFHFKAPAAGGDIFVLDSDNASLGFFGCTADSRSTTAATAFIVATAATNLHVVDCEAWGAFSDAVIEIAAGDAHGLQILRNKLEGAHDGIHINSGVTDSSGATQNRILIAENYIRSTEICINDESDIAEIMNNNVVTANAKGSGGAGAIVGNEFLSSGNKISASDLANADWPALGSL